MFQGGFVQPQVEAPSPVDIAEARAQLEAVRALRAQADAAQPLDYHLPAAGPLIRLLDTARHLDLVLRGGGNAPRPLDAAKEIAAQLPGVWAQYEHQRAVKAQRAAETRARLADVRRQVEAPIDAALVEQVQAAQAAVASAVADVSEARAQVEALARQPGPDRAKWARVLGERRDLLAAAELIEAQAREALAAAEGAHAGARQGVWAQALDAAERKVEQAQLELAHALDACRAAYAAAEAEGQRQVEATRAVLQELQAARAQQP